MFAIGLPAASVLEAIHVLGLSGLAVAAIASAGARPDGLSPLPDTAAAAAIEATSKVKLK